MKISNSFHSLLFRSNIQENVDLIKLQREMKEKATKFEALQVKYLKLEEVRYQCYFDLKARQGFFTCVCVRAVPQRSKSRSCMYRFLLV